MVRPGLWPSWINVYPSLVSTCSVLLQAGLVSPTLVQNLLPWLDFSSVKLWVAAAAFFDTVRLRAVEGRNHGAFIEILLLGRPGFK